MSSKVELVAKKEASDSAFSMAVVATEPFGWKRKGAEMRETRNFYLSSCIKNKRPAFHRDKVRDGQPSSDRTIFLPQIYFFCKKFAIWYMQFGHIQDVRNAIFEKICSSHGRHLHIAYQTRA